MDDLVREWTDDELEEIKRRFRATYAQASREAEKKLAEQLEEYGRENEEWKRRLLSGDATDAEYRDWLKEQSLRRDYIDGLAGRLSADAVNADRLAVEAVNNTVPSIVSESANMSAFGIEQALGKDTHSFDLYDVDTVRNLIIEQPELLPHVPNPRFDNGIDLRWNKQKFTSAITQSILQGESVQNAAKRVGLVMRMNESAAVRTARTAITGAENAGRVISYRRAKDMGIELEQQWMATLDMRTRHSHRELDGQHVPIGEKFTVDGIELEYPGDPTAPGEYVWNCRCALVPWFEGIEQEDTDRWSDLPKGMTYDEWKSGKSPQGNVAEQHAVVNGENIVGTWKRRQDQFDFVIDDVVNAQGFDGKPRVVSAEEFDRAVKEANGGNGFVAQRTYSAPDQETLDSYRQQLYGGKWYVDCSRGGSAYGCGMYTVSDYSGTITGGMAKEIGVYSRGSYSYIETVTLDPSARIIPYDEIASAKSGIRDEIINRYTMSYIDAHADVLGEEGVEFAMRQYRLAGYGFDYARMNELYGNMSDDARRIANNAMLDAAEAASEELRVFSSMDVGSFAALNGYDAIVADGRGASGSYTIILNRTKLIIKEPK